MHVYNLPLSNPSSAYRRNGTGVFFWELQADDINGCVRMRTFNIQASFLLTIHQIQKESMKFIETYVGFGDCAGVNKIWKERLVRIRSE